MEMMVMKIMFLFKMMVLLRLIFMTMMVYSKVSSPPRPSTPGLGIPMEMTPGQIMEAEISATLLDDPSSP